MNKSKAVDSAGARIVETGSRLHFGLFSLGNPDWAKSDGERNSNHSATIENDLELENDVPRRHFGGIGVMVDHPKLQLEFGYSDRLVIQNDSRSYLKKFVESWCQFCHQHRMVTEIGDRIVDFSDYRTLPVRITLLQCGPRHSGLGVGTQLGLAVGRGLFEHFFSSQGISLETGPAFLAKSVQRGLRSAVGTHGFFRGGFIVDRGKTAEKELGLLDGAIEVNQQWRFLLITSNSRKGLSGKKEKKAFQKIPDIPVEVSHRLQCWVREEIVPSIHAADFSTFSNSLYRFGYQVGQCFASVQGGVFAGKRLARIVEKVRGYGFNGIGQSSWGPTLFCAAEDDDQANWLKQKLIGDVLDSESDAQVVKILGNGRVGSAARSYIKKD